MSLVESSQSQLEVEVRSTQQYGEEEIDVTGLVDTISGIHDNSEDHNIDKDEEAKCLLYKA